MDKRADFEKFFQKATENAPYDYQVRLATDNESPGLVNVPTGLGKTAAIVLSWLWRRSRKSGFRKRTPRRLVYCLPMRTLVEQTASAVRKWLKKLELDKQIKVVVLMGGEDADDWDLYPEQDMILIGTQDMLLSRALNRGYAMSRYRWPVQFGLLNNDCLWVFDEVQLMGSGLATTAQLEVFRSNSWKPAIGCQSIWMSATMHPSWLKTVDFEPEGLNCLKLEKPDRENPEVKRRYRAKKPLAKAKHVMGDIVGLAGEIRLAHQEGTRTLVVVNTVQSARALHTQLTKTGKKDDKPPQIVLIHSRFRPEDRKTAIESLLAEPPESGSIIVATQVVEAGVDVSATTLFTELAPWPSLVQRFGRCNRAGNDKNAKVIWIDLPKDKAKQENAAAPYELEQLVDARKHLKCDNVGPSDLPDIVLTYEHRHVIRSKDLLELFDTTADLAGNDIDIDRFVRETDQSDVQVFWRGWESSAPPENFPPPHRAELCRVGFLDFREFLRNRKDGVRAFRWDTLDHVWSIASPDRIFPGQVYLLHVSAGGYSSSTGWDPSISEPVMPVESPTATASADHSEADAASESNAWLTIADHTNEVFRLVDCLCDELAVGHADALRLAARWHDRGKRHPIFQERIHTDRNGEPRPAPWKDCAWLAKAPGETKDDPGWWKHRYRRRHFRHELASAIAVLMAPKESVPSDLRDLVAYLVAAHHGKVRLSIRSLPNEDRPDPSQGDDGTDLRFARGIWNGDELPEVDLGDAQKAPAVRLSLEPMELGLCEQPPFTGEPSWMERMLTLRDALGPFHLAFLEAILRAADMRVSGQRANTDQQDEESCNG